MSPMNRIRILEVGGWKPELRTQRSSLGLRLNKKGVVHFAV